MDEKTHGSNENDSMTRVAKIEASGLEDVVAATTRLSDVDGEAGRLVIGGAAVEDIAGRIAFEDAIHLLWRGREPSPSESERVRAVLGEAREAAFEQLGDLGDALAMPDGMNALRAAAGHLASNDVRRSTASDRGEDDGLDEALRIIGAIAVFAAAWAHQPAPLRPDPTASHAADYLHMATGRVPKPYEVDALDAYLVTVIDHGMNASTFSARVVASTASDTVSAVVAAIGALKGKLHGGAPGPVLDMLDAIGASAEARGWLERALSRGERIMGMGHRVYRVRDPRAFVLERAITRLEAARRRQSTGDTETDEGRSAIAGANARLVPARTAGVEPAAAAEPVLSTETGVGARLQLARAVEHEAEALLAARHPTRPLRANVEFYTAVLLEAVGLPRALFTPTFAVARSAGWCAHIAEQRAAGRLIRPKSRYVHAPPLAR